MLGFWSVRNEIEDKYSKTTMNLYDLNQTQEVGKAHALLVLLFLQKLGTVQMGSICTYSLPPGPFGKPMAYQHVSCIAATAALSWCGLPPKAWTWFSPPGAHRPWAASAPRGSLGPRAGGNGRQLTERAATRFPFLTRGSGRHFLKAGKSPGVKGHETTTQSRVGEKIPG